MKFIKIIIFFLIIFVGFIGYYFVIEKTTPPKTTSNNNIIGPQSDYKENQDDKDTLVETNNLLLNKVAELGKKVEKLEGIKEQDNEYEVIGENKKDNLDTVKKAVVNKGKELVNNIIEKVNNKLPNYGVNPTDKFTQEVGNNFQQKQGSDTALTWQKTIKSKNQKNLTTTHQEGGSVNQTDKNTIIPRYTIPSNSILGGVLTTALLGRIPVNGQVTDPYRFSMQINDQSLFANFHSNNELKGMTLSGTASGDLLLSCVKATIDSITFIFKDGTISETKAIDIATLTDDYGYPCITGRLITNAPTHLSLGALFGGLTEAAKSRAQAEQTTVASSNGSSVSNVTGNADKFATLNAISGGVGSVQKWVSDRAKSSFDVIYVPLGKSVKLFVQTSVNIDYDKKGRKLVNHISQTQGGNNDELD